MTSELEHVTFQKLIHHIGEASDAAGQFGHLRGDNRWLLIANLLLELKEKVYKLSEDIALKSVQ